MSLYSKCVCQSFALYCPTGCMYVVFFVLCPMSKKNHTHNLFSVYTSFKINKRTVKKKKKSKNSIKQGPRVQQCKIKHMLAVGVDVPPFKVPGRRYTGYRRLFLGRTIKLQVLGQTMFWILNLANSTYVMLTFVMLTYVMLTYVMLTT